VNERFLGCINQSEALQLCSMASFITQCREWPSIRSFPLRGAPLPSRLVEPLAPPALGLSWALPFSGVPWNRCSISACEIIRWPKYRVRYRRRLSLARLRADIRSRRFIRFRPARTRGSTTPNLGVLTVAFCRQGNCPLRIRRSPIKFQFE
jgi:hypothetical protein